MKYFIVLLGKKVFILLYNWVVSVLLGVSIMVGCCVVVIIFVNVKVLFEFVILSRVWWVKFVFNFFSNCLIVVGWLLVGW